MVQARHSQFASRFTRIFLVGFCTLMPLVGCMAERPQRHPQDVTSLLADNPAPPQPKFAPLSTEETTALFDDKKGSPYLIGVADVLQVIGDTQNLVGFGETSKGDVIGTRVKADGNIYLPGISTPAVPAEGLTVVQLQDRLRDLLKSEKENPFVSVDVLEYRSQRFYVMGAVGTPGVFPVDGTVTLIEGLTLAGALTPEADLDRAYFVRDAKILPISIGDMLIRGQTQKNIYMQHGDLVVVPHWDKQQIVYMLGEVAKAGPVPFINGRLTLTAALTAAGGIDKERADENVVRIFRGNWPNPMSYTLSVAEIYAYGDGIVLKPGDRVLVAPAGMATAGRAMALFQPFLTPLFQGIVSVGTIDTLLNR